MQLLARIAPYCQRFFGFFADNKFLFDLKKKRGEILKITLIIGQNIRKSTIDSKTEKKFILYAMNSFEFKTLDKQFYLISCRFKRIQAYR